MILINSDAFLVSKYNLTEAPIIPIKTIIVLPIALRDDFIATWIRIYAINKTRSVLINTENKLEASTLIYVNG
jgi:hypothetical protein